LGGWCAVVWGEEGEVNDRRVQENKWLSAKPAMLNSARQRANRIFRSRCTPMIELTRQNTNQPEREFLENGENGEIRKIRNNKPKCTKPELPKDPAKKRKSEKQKIENKTA